MPYLPEPYKGGNTDIDRALAFPGISLQDFMERTTVYEHTPVLFTPRLRQGAWVGMLLTLITSSVVWLLPMFEGYIAGIFFPWFHGLNEYLKSYLRWLAHNPWIGSIDLVLLCVGVLLLILTGNLRRGGLGQQWLAFVEALGGCANLVLLVVPVAMILANLLVWLVVIVVGCFVFLILVRLVVALLV
ncbi:MAG: hypothetical protein JOZ18_10590 [Chloroflexi bacterium]|nr:hypothetical protein [Chloroflexota bacterium]